MPAWRDYRYCSRGNVFFVNTSKLRLIFLCLILNGFIVNCTLWSSCVASMTEAHLTMCPTRNNSKDNQIEMKCTFSLSLVVDARGPQPKRDEENKCSSCCSVQRSARLRVEDGITQEEGKPLSALWEVPGMPHSAWWEGRFSEETASGAQSI